NTTYNAVLDGEIALPCNITAPSFDDGVSLVLWYRDDIASPIYTVDARQSVSLESAQHFLHTDIFEKRASFNLSYPLSFLRIKPVKPSDGGDYRCRVDFRRARTVNRILKLTVIVPTTNVLIYDANLQRVDKVAGPFDEDSSIDLICDASEGNPLPVVHWWRGSNLIDSDYLIVNKTIVRNVLSLANLTRDDLLMTLTCQAYNTNLTVPVTRTITLDLHLKPREIRIITPMQNISSGGINGNNRPIELACQCIGSKPSATIKWRKGPDIIEPFSETVSDDGMTTTSFISLVPSIEDNGKQIECIGFNPSIVANFTIKDTWPINIYYLPILSLIMGSDSRSTDIIEGSNVYFECNIKANPYVTEVGWKLNGHLVDSTSNSGIMMRNTSLLVTNVNHDHYGEYQCYAANSLGSVHSESVFLNVKYAPKCRHNRAIPIGVAVGEVAAIECQVLANPSDVVFEWAMNGTSSSPKVPLSYDQSGSNSVAKFVATTEQDYGYLHCWARNNVGKQKQPCVYHIIKAEPPNNPHNCSLVNKTAHSLTLECLPGYSGGLQQTFYLQVYSINPNRLLKNLSNPEAPYFAISDLPAGYIFKLVIYSSNRKGNSKSIEITGSTTEPSPWKSAEYESSELYYVWSQLAIVLALVLLLLVSIVLVWIKIRQRLSSRKRTMVYTEKGTLPRKSIMKKRAESESRINGCSLGFGTFTDPDETIEMNDLTFKPDYPIESLETCSTNFVPTIADTTNVNLNAIVQPYFVPSNELPICDLQCSSKPELATFSYDLCGSIAMIDVRTVH
ncbi:hypothetical protein BLOT_007351, partial [Blomia tropicalis]